MRNPGESLPDQRADDSVGPLSDQPHGQRASAVGMPVQMRQENSKKLYAILRKDTLLFS